MSDLTTQTCYICQGTGRRPTTESIGKPPHPSRKCERCNGEGVIPVRPDMPAGRGIVIVHVALFPEDDAARVYEAPAESGRYTLWRLRTGDKLLSALESARRVRQVLNWAVWPNSIVYVDDDRVLAEPDPEAEPEAKPIEGADPGKPDVFGMEAWPLPEGSMPTGFYVIVMGLDKDGAQAFWTRTNGMSQMEIVGGLDVMAELERNTQAKLWRPVDPKDYA